MSWNVRKDGWKIPFDADAWRNAKPAFALVDAKTGEEIFAANQKISPRAANKAAKDGLNDLLIPTEEVFGRYSAVDLINEKTGEIYIEAGDEVSAENLEGSTMPASMRSNCSISTKLTPAPGSATRWRSTRPKIATRRCPISTASCARANHQRRKPQKPVRRPVLRCGTL